jgi:hypothetical protein
MQIQAYLTAAAINLKRLAAWIAALLCAVWALVVETIGEQRPDDLPSSLVPPSGATLVIGTG